MIKLYGYLYKTRKEQTVLMKQNKPGGILYRFKVEPSPDGYFNKIERNIKNVTLLECIKGLRI